MRGRQFGRAERAARRFGGEPEPAPFVAPSMSDARRALALALFGLATTSSGLYRYLSAPDGEKGLWFGLVMGGLALAGALLLARGPRSVGLALGTIAVALVLGWFVYEALVKKGLAVAEYRQLALIVFAAVTGAALAWPRRRGLSAER